MMSLPLDTTSAAATSADISATATSAVAAAFLICSYSLLLPLLAAMFQSELFEKAAPSLLRRNHASWQIIWFGMTSQKLKGLARLILSAV